MMVMRPLSYIWEIVSAPQVRNGIYQGTAACRVLIPYTSRIDDGESAISIPFRGNVNVGVGKMQGRGASEEH